MKHRNLKFNSVPLLKFAIYKVDDLYIDMSINTFHKSRDKSEHNGSSRNKESLRATY